MKRFCIALLTGMMMLCVCCLPAAAADVMLYDEKDILNEQEYDECLAILQEAADSTGMNIGVILGSQQRSEYTTRSFADAAYDEAFGAKTDGLLYYMDLNGRDPYDYISTSGLGQFYYTNSSSDNRIDAIFSDIDPYLYPVGREDAVGALRCFAEDVEFYYYAGIPDRYYVYDDSYHCYYYVEDGELLESDTRPYLNWTNAVSFAFMFLVGGIVGALVVFFAVKSHYTFKTALSPTAYVNRKSMQFQRKEDNFVRSYVKKVHVDSGGGHGGGGGHHGGGGHSFGGHGGGGHHR
jgi:uncharacterized protein